MNTENNYTETDLGNVSPNPRGAYDDGTEYEFLDVVELGGGSYLCRAELGTKITGVEPTPGKTTQEWQCIAMPGDMTPEYVAAHDAVEANAKRAEADREAAELAMQEAAASQRTVTQMQENTLAAEKRAHDSMDSAAGYAQEAKKSQELAENAENNMRILAEGFDSHVEDKTGEAKEAIEATRKDAVAAVVAQQNTSTKAVKEQTEGYITQKEKEAADNINRIVDSLEMDVNAILKNVTDEGEKQLQSITHEGKKYADATTQQASEALISAQQAKESETNAQEYMRQTRQLSITNVGNLEFSINVEKSCLVVAFEE